MVRASPQNEQSGREGRRGKTGSRKRIGIVPPVRVDTPAGMITLEVRIENQILGALPVFA